MTTKVNGAAYPGVWVERKVAFVKITFSTDISALAAADLFELGTTTAVSAGTVADATFGVVESVLVQALKTLETQATVLAVSKYHAASSSIDVMLGNAEGWFSDVNGVIATGLTFGAAQAVITTAGSAAADAVGALVSVNPESVKFGINFAAFNGTLDLGTAANGTLALGIGATSGATPVASTTGTAGYYPVEF